MHDTSIQHDSGAFWHTWHAACWPQTIKKDLARKQQLPVARPLVIYHDGWGPTNKQGQLGQRHGFGISLIDQRRNALCQSGGKLHLEWDGMGWGGNVGWDGDMARWGGIAISTSGNSMSMCSI